MVDIQPQKSPSDTDLAVNEAQKEEQKLLLQKELAAQEKFLQRNQKLATWLDAKFGIPGTRFRFGIESIIGLVPVAGDYVGAIMSGIIMLDAARSGISKKTLMLMFRNVLLEFGVGAIPIIGDIFDFLFKANMRNVDLIRQELNDNITQRQAAIEMLSPKDPKTVDQSQYTQLRKRLTGKIKSIPGKWLAVILVISSLTVITLFWVLMYYLFFV